MKRTLLEVKRIIDAKAINDILKEKEGGKPFEIESLERIDVFEIKKEDKILSLAIISHISKQDVKIKELIMRCEYRHQGFGTKLLKQLVGNYKQKYKNMIIGVAGEHIPFFVQNWFNSFMKQGGNVLYYQKKLQNNK